jgi:hypothetical protein
MLANQSKRECGEVIANDGDEGGNYRNNPHSTTAIRAFGQ